MDLSGIQVELAAADECGPSHLSIGAFGMHNGSIYSVQVSVPVQRVRLPNETSTLV